MKPVLQALAALCLLFAGHAGAENLYRVPIKSTLAQRRSDEASAPAVNAALKVITAVQAGDDQVFADVLVDTGSAILWVGALQPYVPGKYTQVINETFSIGYSGGGAEGIAYIDRVTIGDAVVDSQIIGAANYSVGLQIAKPIDGIFGLGPSGSNEDEVSGYYTTPTFVENLVSEGKIDRALFGIYVSPVSEEGIPEGLGEITFGGVDESRFQGEIEWLEQTEPYNQHWSFNVSSVSWGDQLLAEQPIDLALFPILDMVPGASIDLTSFLEGCAIFPSNMTAENLPDITIGVGSLNFVIPASRYIVPKTLYSALNITDDLTHTYIGAGGFGEFFLGQKFLEGAYSAYDMDNHLVGLAYPA
ncbi:acid protease [Laetiporus sulphureus 93-53]|uniref:Acid protease n=1 Tax=Laetiporus sulphureus 93-53 TaxID=1314785 RepID=A0A165BNW7_9APHY|nr:acid protease [Laetiporus sulphureus 93-53]KZT01387.1 acid protease [Laetiporus sulphureus 93-53]